MQQALKGGLSSGGGRAAKLGVTYRESLLYVTPPAQALSRAFTPFTLTNRFLVPEIGSGLLRWLQGLCAPGGGLLQRLVGMYDIRCDPSIAWASCLPQQLQLHCPQRDTVGPAKSATVGTLLIFGSCVTREVGAGGGSWRILRETPATLLGGDAARMTPEDFDKAVEARARDSTRKWQLDVLGLICAEHLLVSRFSLRSGMPSERALSVHALIGCCCRSSTLRLRKRLPVSRGVAAECIHFDVGFALSHRECIVPTTSCTSNPGGCVFSEHLVVRERDRQADSSGGGGAGECTCGAGCDVADDQ